jgi:hypothetical protein
MDEVVKGPHYRWANGTGLAFPEEPEQVTHHGEYQEDEKQKLANFYGTGGNATKAEKGCNERYDKEDNGVVQHFWAPKRDASSVAAGAFSGDQAARRVRVGQSRACA